MTLAAGGVSMTFTETLYRRAFASLEFKCCIAVWTGMVVPAPPSQARHRALRQPRSQLSIMYNAYNSPTTILCIEDEMETAAILAEDLTERGYRVLSARRGDEGLGTLFAERPNLVLCDINLPGMSGFDVLEGVKAKSPGCGYPPFIFLTAFTDRESELRGRKLGADDYVAKPVDFELLHAIIKLRLARTTPTDTRLPDVALNDREVETLTWAARGKTSYEIAVILGLSKRTVDFHADNARTKLGATTRIEATIRAVSGRLIHP